MTLDEWLYEEDQRLTKGIESWNEFLEFQENQKNKTESENKE